MITVENRPYTPYEKIGSSAFRIEYKPDVPKKALVDDIVLYLGEYRFKLPSSPVYNLDFADGQLIDPNRRDSMAEISQRAIDLKNGQGKSSAREQAEKKGFQKLDQELKLAKTGDTIIWMSPMGAKSEGYGDYGFVFFGKVNGDGYDKKISMIAKRIENPTLEQFNKLNEILTQEKTAYQNAEDFLSNPKVLKENISEENIDLVLKKVFAFKPNREVLETFNKIMDKMSSIVSDLADLLKNLWKTIGEKLKGLNSVENYALKLKKEYEVLPWGKIIYDRNQKLGDIVGDYGHKPPTALGSCGSSSSIKSNNPFSFGFDSLNNIFLEEDKFGERTFECPECGKTNIRPKDELLKNCQHCGSDKVSC